MTEVGELSDPRPQLRAALDQTQHQVDAVGSADLHRPTPCAAYDVRTLLAHLLAVVRKLQVAGRGGDTTTVPDPADDLGDDWAAAFRRAHVELERVWEPDAMLDGSYRMPWATMTGRELLNAYAHEFTVHAWDLAQVTGRNADLDPALAEAALDWYGRNLPADNRGGQMPFGPTVPVAEDADAYARLAGFVGRTWPAEAAVG